jgi:hypothetical protein
MIALTMAVKLALKRMHCERGRPRTGEGGVVFCDLPTR